MIERPLSRAWAGGEAMALFSGLADLEWPAYEWLLRQGVPSGALVAPELPRRAPVVFHAGRPIFDLADDLDEESCTALVFLARDSCGEVADLVAWSPHHRRLATLFGAVAVLGADDILAPRLTAKGALPIHRTPLGWLRAARAGVVILSTDRAAIELRDFGPFAAEDEAHGREMRRMFDAAAPTIYVSERKAA